MAKVSEAGSDIIETNTFSSTTISQADYELESIVEELNIEAANFLKPLGCATAKTRKPMKFEDADIRSCWILKWKSHSPNVRIRIFPCSFFGLG